MPDLWLSLRTLCFSQCGKANGTGIVPVNQYEAQRAKISSVGITMWEEYEKLTLVGHVCCV